MSLEPVDDDVPTPAAKSTGRKTKELVKKRNQLRRKRYLEERLRMYGSLSDRDRGRLEELQDLYD